jgi:hypothetical protein
MVEVRVPLLAAAAIVLAACTSQEARREAELAQVIQLLPGRYDNTAQARADALAGVRPPHEALALAVVPVYAPMVGNNVFYVQEMAADDPRRVMAQKLWTFESTGEGIVQSVWTLSEPLRWRDAHLNPEVLQSLMAQDVARSRGCELTWKKIDTRFVASNDPARCRMNSRVGNEPVQVDTRVELDSGELALAEVTTQADGRLVQGRSDEPFYRFRKQAP